MGEKRVREASLRKPEQRLHHLLEGLRGDGRTAVGAEGLSHPGKKESEVIVDLGHGPHGRARVPGHAPLVNGNGRREAFHRFHVRPLHLFQKLPGIGRKGFDVPPLALCIEGVKGKGGFPRAAQDR